MSFLGEIKRRKVYHVAAAYLVVAWLLVQVVATIEEPLLLPDWFDTAVIVLLGVGFPIALILSWTFAITPQGIVRDDAPARGDDRARVGEHQASGSGNAAATTDQVTDGGQTRTLADIVAAGPLPISNLLRVAVQIADALANLHRNGRVHGALTPQHVLIGDNDEVSLLGVAAAQAGNGKAYLSPEQLHGEPPDFRSDQFALGALLYEMAAGRRAFGTSGNRADPEPVTRLNPQLPMPLVWLIERCLATRPQLRFARSDELLDEVAAIGESVRLAAAATAGTPNNLPAQRTSLIGRDKDLASIHKLIARDDTRIVTLTGAGGIGKTRLLIELGRHLLDEFPGGVFFVPLDRINDAELVASEIINALDAWQVLDNPTAAGLQRYLRQHCSVPTLLLIDNFEHLMPAAPLLAELLSAVERLKIVVTSRAALRVYGEHEFQVLPLAMPRRADAGTGEALAKSPAVQLFLDRATWMQKADAAERRLIDTDLKMVAEICERLDGLPLAIELAAARSRILSLPALLEHVRDPLKFLAGGPRDLPERHKTLRATLDWSYDLLDENLQKLFRRLGVFVGGATLEAIEAVCNVGDDLGIDLIAATEALVESNLLSPMDATPSGRRFTMLETMRAYSLERLEEAEESSHTRRAHAAYFLVLSEESSLVDTESKREALYQQFELELGNLRAALDWLMAAGSAEWGLRLACGLSQYWQHRGRVLEGYERMTNLLEIDAGPGDTELHAVALAWCGEFATHRGEFEVGRQHYLESLLISRKLHAVPGILRSLNGLAVSVRRGSGIDEAIPYLEEALEVARETGGSASLVGSVMTNVANFVLQQGDFDRAQQLHEEAARLFEEAGDHLALAWSLDHQGDIARRRGDAATAKTLYETAMTRFCGLNERLGIAGCLHDLAGLAADAGDHRSATALNRDALALYCALDHKADIPRVLDAMAISAAETGNADQAMRLAGCGAGLRKYCSLYLMDATETQLSRSLDTARQQMGGSEAAASWMAGWNMQPEQAIAFALAGQGGKEQLPA